MSSCHLNSCFITLDDDDNHDDDHDDDNDDDNVLKENGFRYCALLPCQTQIGNKIPIV